MSLIIALTLMSLAAEEPREVPKKLVPVLNAAERALEADDPTAAVRILSSWEGEADPLQQLLLGYAHLDEGAPKRAAAAFERALELDPALERARIGFARALAEAEDWSGVVEALRTRVDVQQSEAPMLGLYARAAFEVGDLRLATLLVERAMIRFPEDLALRRLDVALLLRREQWSGAAEAALGVLSLEPHDALAWSQLAAALERSGGALALAATEAASLVDPSVGAALAGKLVRAGAPEDAIETLRSLPVEGSEQVRAVAALRARRFDLELGQAAGVLHERAVARKALTANDPQPMLRLAASGAATAEDLLELVEVVEGPESTRWLELAATQCGPHGAMAAAQLAERVPARASAIGERLRACASRDELTRGAGP